MPADPEAVRELFGTLEMLAAVRRDDGSVGEAALTVAVDLGGKEIRLRVARGAGPTDRVWAARGDRGGRFLIDGYAARALDVDADSLRERRPFRGRTAGARRIEVGEEPVVLVGPPWRVELAGGAARADAGAVQRLLEQLDRLRVDDFQEPAGGARADPGGMQRLLERLDWLRVSGFQDAAAGGARADPGGQRLLERLDWLRVGGFQDAADGGLLLAVHGRAGRAALVQLGECAGGGSLVDTPAGTACARLPAALTEAASEPRRLVDRRLVGASIDAVGRLRLERGGRSIDVTRADVPDTLRDWLARWRDAAAGPLIDAGELSAPVAAIQLDVDGGGVERVSVARAGGRLAARRDGEPVALLLHEWAAAHLEPAPYRFRSLDLLSYEPSGLRAAAARGSGKAESIERGDTLEEWRDGSGAAVPLAAVDRLRQVAGFLRAERFVAAQARPEHGLSPPRRTVELTFDPPPDQTGPRRHQLSIGAARDGGTCYARLDRDPAVFELAAARCAALLGPWTER